MNRLNPLAHFTTKSVIGAMLVIAVAAAAAVIDPSLFGPATHDGTVQLAGISPLGVVGAIGAGLGRVFYDQAGELGGGGGGGGAAVADPVLSRAAGNTGGTPNAEALRGLDLEHATPEQKTALEAVYNDVGPLYQELHKLFGEKQTASGADAGRVDAAITAAKAREDQLRTEVEKLQGEIRARNSVSGAEGHIMGKTTDDPTKGFSVIRAMQGAFAGWKDWNPAHPERDVCQEYMKSKDVPLEYRDTIHDTTTAGQLAVLIPPQVMPDFIERLSANTVALNAGATMIPDLAGSPVMWPRVEGGITGEWVAEATPPADSQVTMGALRLTPKELASSASISKRLMRLTNEASNRLIEDDMTRVQAETLDTGIIRGGGGEATPLGIANTPGIGTLDVSGTGVYGAIDFDGTAQNVTDYANLTVAKVDARNAYKVGGKMAWAGHPLAIQKLRTSKDQDGRPLFFDMLDGREFRNTAAIADRGASAARGQFWGHPIYSSTNLLYGSVTDLMFGNWGDVIVGGWGPLLLEMSENYQDYFKKRLVMLMMTQLVDAGLRHPAAFELWVNWSNTAISL